MWGTYLCGMWSYGLGVTKAKEHALTGKQFSGCEAADIELINEAVPFADLESAIRQVPWLSAKRLVVAACHHGSNATHVDQVDCQRRQSSGSYSPANAKSSQVRKRG